MADLAFHPEAQAEYEAALAWYQARNPRVAASFEAAVDRLLQQIQATPLLFSPYDRDHRYAILRRFPYSIVFAIQPNTILIVAIAHSSRAVGYWQGRA